MTEFFSRINRSTDNYISFGWYNSFCMLIILSLCYVFIAESVFGAKLGAYELITVYHLCALRTICQNSV